MKITKWKIENNEVERVVEIESAKLIRSESKSEPERLQKTEWKLVKQTESGKANNMECKAIKSAGRKAINRYPTNRQSIGIRPHNQSANQSDRTTPIIRPSAHAKKPAKVSSSRLYQYYNAFISVSHILIY